MTAITTDHIDTRQVLALATPELYRKNLFRVLGLPVTATVQDARRRQKRLDMARKLGTDGARVDGHDLLTLREPDEHDIRVALERLSDPKSRWLDEIFWFWPTVEDGAEDPGLAALERGDVQGAFDAWAADSEPPEREAAKVHNRVLLNHLIALDLDAWQTAHSAPESGSARDLDSSLKAVWAKALAGWREVLDSEAFWRRVKRRVDELNDPQLTTGTIHRLREILSQALLSINAQIALNAAERGDEELAHAQVQVLRQSAPDSAAADTALHAVLQPIRHRIESLGEQAKQKAEANPEQGNTAASDLLEQTKPLLRTLDLLLSDTDALRSGAHDGVAEAAMKCLVAYGNKTENWQEMIRVLDIAIPLAVGEAQRTRMVENRKQAERNQQGEICYFCGKEKPDPDKAVEVKMYGDVKRAPNWSQNTVETTWRHGTIRVPRCGNCASWHKGPSMGVFWTVFSVMLFITCLRLNFLYGVNSFHFALGLLDGGIFGIFAHMIYLTLRRRASTVVYWTAFSVMFYIGFIGRGGFLVGLFMGTLCGAIAHAIYLFVRWVRGRDLATNKGIRKVSDIYDYLPIKELCQQGWKFGEKPT